MFIVLFPVKIPDQTGDFSACHGDYYHGQSGYRPGSTLRSHVKKLGSSTKICEVWIGMDDIWLDINYSILWHTIAISLWTIVANHLWHLWCEMKNHWVIPFFLHLAVTITQSPRLAVSRLAPLAWPTLATTRSRPQGPAEPMTKWPLTSSNICNLY